MTPFKCVQAAPLIEAQIADIARLGKTSIEEARIVAEETQKHAYFQNDKYLVSMQLAGIDCLGWPAELVHLSIKRLDVEAIHDWRELQRIKNELVGPEFEAIELYPAESRLLDTANQYHLWVAITPGFKFPFGVRERLVTNEGPLGGKQRPFEESTHGPQ